MGGIPTAVSETMVRNHFSQWGQVTELASSYLQMMHLVASFPADMLESTLSMQPLCNPLLLMPCLMQCTLLSYLLCL